MGHITFVVGGARSGKSSYAVGLASKAKKAAFIATCEALDREMALRIKKHRRDRPGSWTTYEEPRELAALVNSLHAGHDFVLIDCLTLFVSNLILKKRKPGEIERHINSVIKALKKRKSPSVIVSNEVGLGIVPNTRLGRDFRDVAGSINKVVAERSDRMVFMISGIPWRIK
ncbi:MAG: bifunctional adenosylcobinamide kinase/adenosylcobinamide-phosphate guanylyltransferase [Candidatus Omnitrophica bacterium]|nr:bifunctional adenosylcobinamide kinase/adenosylcobinamide-phosphate guanylyltransferase [Candidatus Omnitrophota bacterium]